METLIKRDRYFVLKKNNQVEEYSSITDAIQITDKQFVIIDKFKTFFAPSGGYSWRISEFNFVDGENQPLILSDNQWTIHSIDTTYKSSSSTYFEITLSDPLKRIRRIVCKLNAPKEHSDSNLHDITLVQLALDKLHEHSKFHSWEEFDLNNENLTLKNKVEQLEKQVHELKSTTNA